MNILRHLRIALMLAALVILNVLPTNAAPQSKHSTKKVNETSTLTDQSTRRSGFDPDNRADIFFKDLKAKQHSRMLDIKIDSNKTSIVDRLDQVATLSYGQSANRILEVIGTPYQRRTVGPNESKSVGGADTKWEYCCGLSCIDLYFKDGMCIGSKGARKSNFAPGEKIVVVF